LPVLILGLMQSVSSLAASRIFYDGFETGTTDLWKTADYRNRCTVVTAAFDATVGPYQGAKMASCNWNGTVVWNDSASFETLALPPVADSNELFYRFRVRLDKDVDKGAGSAGKLLRVYVSSPVYNDMFDAARTSVGLTNEGLAGGNQMPTYWGSATGDATAATGAWHKIEYYFNKSTGTVKVWHDGVVIRNLTGLAFNGAWWAPVYLLSNYADPHDASNHVYFDDIEVFTEAGDTATGSMVDGTIADGSADEKPKPPGDFRAF
jgi:hypothetical protein